MIGKSLNEFIDTLTYGYEMEFLYHDRYFIIQGDTNDNQHKITLNECLRDKSNSVDHELINLTIIGDSFEECVKKLLLCPMIDGKKLCEIEKYIEVLFG